MDTAIWDTLVRINNHYGKGDIVEVDLTNHEVIRHMPFAGTDVRGYSVNGNRVTFLGQTRTIGYQIR